jgi:hypothetical protein
MGCVDRIALARAITELPVGYRTIFLLHEVEGHEHQEIAAQLNCSVGNSKSQLHKAKLRLRDLLVRAQRQTKTSNRGRAIRQLAVENPVGWEAELVPQLSAVALAPELTAIGE